MKSDYMLLFIVLIDWSFLIALSCEYNYLMVAVYILYRSVYLHNIMGHAGL